MTMHNLFILSNMLVQYGTTKFIKKKKKNWGKISFSYTEHIIDVFIFAVQKKIAYGNDKKKNVPWRLRISK